MDDLSSLLAIDPGQTTGWAFFKAGLLFAAGYGAHEFFKDGSNMPDEATHAKKVVIELPHHFSSRRKADVQDLIMLGVRVGELKQTWRSRGSDILLVWPQTWKGSVPKEIHNKRVLEMLAQSEKELLPTRPRAKDFDNNMVDAIGIGLWKLGRM
jgi:hypothetical protein